MFSVKINKIFKQQEDREEECANLVKTYLGTLFDVNRKEEEENMNRSKVKISFNSPVIISFTAVCFLSLLLSFLTRGISNDLLFSVYHSSLASPLTYIRFFGHVFGHAGWEHFIGNITLLLVVGPLLEEKYGSKAILGVILSTAFVTGLIHWILFPGSMLLGASGVVFALIILSSFTSMEEGQIPLTFILVALIYIGEQVYQGIFVKDNISNLTHIAGGVVGAVYGRLLNREKHL